MPASGCSMWRQTQRAVCGGRRRDARRCGQRNRQGSAADLVEPPYWFGEISLFDGLPRTHDAFADSASTLLLLPQAGLLALLEREPQHWRDFALLMSHKLRLAFIAWKT